MVMENTDDRVVSSLERELTVPCPSCASSIARVFQMPLSRSVSRWANRFGKLAPSVLLFQTTSTSACERATSRLLCRAMA